MEQAISTIAPPEWEITEAKAYRHDEGIPCERCGTYIYATVFSVKNLADGTVKRVGSECVKKLTGQSVSQLQYQSATYHSRVCLQAKEAERLARVAAFLGSHTAELAWLDEHIERIHEVANRMAAAQRNLGPYQYAPRIPSAEWWEHLRDQANTMGEWSQRQAESLAREMAVKHTAALPEVKTKGEYVGTVRRVFFNHYPPMSRWGMDRYKTRVEFIQADGVLVTADFNSGTKNYQAALCWLSTGNQLDPKNAGLGIDLPTPAKFHEMCLGLQSVTVTGKVKAHRAVGGGFYLSGAKLVAFTKKEGGTRCCTA